MLPAGERPMLIARIDTVSIYPVPGNPQDSAVSLMVSVGNAGFPSTVQGWSLEVAIPWVNFEELAKRPAPGDVWTANLNRWDGVEPNRRLSMWSDPVQSRPHPHVPARFGQLVFVQNSK